MYPLVAIALALILLVLLLRCKIRVGRAMVLTTLFITVLLWVSPLQTWSGLILEWNSRPLGETTGYLFVSIAGLLYLVNVLGEAMQITGVSERLVPALHGLFRSRRMALAAIPMLMGLLPTPGGIMLSAPMVRHSGDRIGVDRAHQAAINYFFRHQWESVWPLFPAIPLIQGLLGISIGQLVAHNIFLCVIGLAAGVVFLLTYGIPPRNPEHTAPSSGWQKNLRHFINAFWPIALAAILAIVLNIPAGLGLLAALMIFLLLHHIPVKNCGQIFKKAFEADFVLLVLAALCFKLNLEVAGAIPQIVDFLTGLHVPPPVLVFLLPFLVSFVTGMTTPSIIITFPLLAGFIGSGPACHVGLQTLAFSGILCALACSPIHLCLALSCSYFEAPFGRILLRLIGPVIVLFATGVVSAYF